MVEDEGWRQRQTGRGRQAVADLDRGHRVEAGVPEGTVVPHGGGRVVPEDDRDLLAYQVEGHRDPLVAVQFPEPRRPGAAGHGRRSRGRAVGSRVGQVGEHRARARRGIRRDETWPLDVGDDREWRPTGDRPAQAGESEVRIKAVDARTVGGGLVPRPPGDRGRRQAASVPTGSEARQVGVRHRLSALAQRAEHAHKGGKQHERRGRAVDQLVEVGSSAQHRRERGVDARGVVARTVDADEVDDGVELVPVRGESANDVGEGRPIGYITGQRGRPHSDPGELVDERARAWGVRTSAADESDLFGAVGGGPPGHPHTQLIGEAGYQHAAARPPSDARSAARRRVIGRGPNQPASEGGRLADGHLLLAAGQRADQPPGDRLGRCLRNVDQPAPDAGPFQSLDPAEAPEHRLIRAWGPLGGIIRIHGVCGRASCRHTPDRRVDLRDVDRVDQGHGFGDRRRKARHAGGDPRRPQRQERDDRDRRFLADGGPQVPGDSVGM